MTVVFKSNALEIVEHRPDKVLIREFNQKYVSVILVEYERIHLVKQFRESVGRLTYELPGGRVEEGESLEEAARRELAEETGYICGELMYIGQIDSYASVINRENHFFFSTILLSTGRTNMDEDEDIEMEIITLEELKHGIREGKYCDSELLAGMFLCHAASVI